MRNWLKSFRRSRQVTQTIDVDPKDMIGTDRSVIYCLQHSDNDDYFALSGLTGRYPRKAGMPWTRPSLPSEDCPPGVTRKAMEPILDWTKHLDEIVIKFKKGVPHQLPDRLSFQSYTVVSARCRELCERIDPDGGHVYIPASLLKADKKPVGGEWFYMWCCRTFFADKVKQTAAILEDAMMHGFHYERHVATPERCEFFKEIPMWTVIGAPGPKYMSLATFAQVKESGITGFRELTMPDLRYDPKEDDDLPSAITPPNVSHIWF